jgi:uncharacterized protein YndB with AHSA1/START domain
MAGGVGDLRLPGRGRVADLPALARDRRKPLAGGVYTEIDAPRRLAFTFRWDESHEDGPPVDTQVTVDFSETPNGRTVMDFTHEGLKSEQSLTGHKHGWNSTADRLEAWLAANPD